ncbi:MAG TPA: transcription antitermination factor NusB [Bryobacteraceae bacterium]|nr:transcription antitermination factor NusB [Bryobacteraceae bacterium]
MPARHRSRERALQVLFLADIRQQTAEEAIAGFYGSLLTSDGGEEKPEPDSFMEQLARGALADRAGIDKLIAGQSEHWRLDRMPIVDRNILRLAIHEMMSIGTPAPVVIDEALELARRFSSEESVAFVNGVLDAVRRAGAERVRPLLPDAEGGEDPV